MNHTVQYLTTEAHFSELLKIYYSHSKVMRGFRDRNSEPQLTDMHKAGIKYVGYFQDQTLIAFLRVREWKEKFPSYWVGNLNIKKQLEQSYDFSNGDHPVIDIMNFVLSEAENKGLYTWYYSRSLTSAYHKLQLKGADLLRNCDMGWDSNTQEYRYERFIEEVVPAGELPRFETNRIIQKYPFDHDYMIVKCCLKNKYRHTPDYFDNTVIEQCLKTTRSIRNT